MDILIYDAKIRQDEQSKQWLGNAIAALYFYHGTAIKVSKNYVKTKYKKLLKISLKIYPHFHEYNYFNINNFSTFFYIK